MMSCQITVPDFYLHVARGMVPGHRAVNKYGHNGDVDAVVPEDIWSVGGVLDYLLAPEPMLIWSGSDQDSLTGAGARRVRIFGLDGQYRLIDEWVDLQGTTAVTTTQAYLRVYRMYIGPVGASGVNEATIFCDPAGQGATSRQAQIMPREGQTTGTHYTVPGGVDAYLTGAYVSVGRGVPLPGTSVREIEMRLFIRERRMGWRMQQNWLIRSDGGAVAGDLAFKAPLKLKPRSDIRWSAKADSSNTAVYAQYGLIEIDRPDDGD